MPADRKPLTLLPSSVSSLAAAEVGEEVVVRAAMEGVPSSAKLIQSDDGYAVFRHRTFHTVVDTHRVAPAAEGERVEMECPFCAGKGAWLLRGDPQDPVEYDGCKACDTRGAIPATAVSDPVPSPWCEECEGVGEMPGSTEGGGVPVTPEPCPDCGGDPPFAWRLTLLKETRDD